MPSCDDHEAAWEPAWIPSSAAGSQALTCPVGGDLVAGTSLQDALARHGVQLVFHVASPHPNGSNRRLFYDVNVTGTASVLEACLAAGVRAVVYTSSASVVWAGAPQEGVDESVPLPRTFRDYYAETKAMAEALVMEAGAPARAAPGALIRARPGRRGHPQHTPNPQPSWGPAG